MTIERHVKACWFAGTAAEEVGQGHKQELGWPIDEKYRFLIQSRNLHPRLEPVLVFRAIVIRKPDSVKVSVFTIDENDMSKDVELEDEIILEKDEINQRQDLLQVGGVFERIIGRKVTYSWRPG